jgi:hypothetical protein
MVCDAFLIVALLPVGLPCSAWDWVGWRVTPIAGRWVGAPAGRHCRATEGVKGGETDSVRWSV